MPISSPTPDRRAPHDTPVQYHSEFGYFVPAMSLRRKASLIGRGVLLGAVLGTLTIGALLSLRDAPASLFSMQLQAAPDDAPQGQPVRFVSSSLALPAAVRSTGPAPAAARPAPPAMAAASPIAHAAPVATAPVAATEPEVQTSASRPQQKVKRKPTKKIARQPPRNRNFRVIEDDPRRAYAGPERRFGEPYGGWYERRPFGDGW